MEGDREIAVHRRTRERVVADDIDHRVGTGGAPPQDLAPGRPCVRLLCGHLDVAGQVAERCSDAREAHSVDTGTADAEGYRRAGRVVGLGEAVGDHLCRGVRAVAGVHHTGTDRPQHRERGVRRAATGPVALHVDDLVGAAAAPPHDLTEPAVVGHGGDVDVAARAGRDVREPHQEPAGGDLPAGGHRARGPAAELVATRQRCPGGNGRVGDVGEPEPVGGGGRRGRTRNHQCGRDHHGDDGTTVTWTEKHKHSNRRASMFSSLWRTTSRWQSPDPQRHGFDPMGERREAVEPPLCGGADSWSSDRIIRAGA
jgi:hypothetical protein